MQYRSRALPGGLGWKRVFPLRVEFPVQRMQIRENDFPVPPSPYARTDPLNQMKSNEFVHHSRRGGSVFFVSQDISAIIREKQPEWLERVGWGVFRSNREFSSTVVGWLEARLTPGGTRMTMANACGCGT